MDDTQRRNIIKRNNEIAESLQPESVFTLFAELSAVPRRSGHVEKVASFLAGFAERHKLLYSKDASGNVIIKKPAQNSASKTTVILQAHQDMVCVKASGIEHDFAADPIALVLDGDGWLRADGATLGADNGIGVALALAVLTDGQMSHPPVEALFTVDEETDMKGAKAVKPGDLSGNILINLDAEELHIAYVSSAAGASVLARLPRSRAPERAPQTEQCLKIRVGGLLGGHSGLEIHTARANAYVLLARFLTKAVDEGLRYSLYSLEQGEGGGAENAIPDRAEAVLGLPPDGNSEAFAALTKSMQAIFANEYRASDPGVRLEIQKTAPPQAAPLTHAERDILLRVLRLVPLGVYRFAQVEGFTALPYEELLVESSCNLGIVAIDAEGTTLNLLARSSTASVLDDLLRRIEDVIAMAGGSFQITNRTQGWEMPAAATALQRLFEQQGLKCKGIHAGLECGCLVSAFKDAGRTLDAISIGPRIKDAHSPKERLEISSVATVWEQLRAVLKAL